MSQGRHILSNSYLSSSVDFNRESGQIGADSTDPLIFISGSQPNHRLDQRYQKYGPWVGFGPPSPIIWPTVLHVRYRLVCTMHWTQPHALDVACRAHLAQATHSMGGWHMLHTAYRASLGHALHAASIPDWPCILDLELVWIRPTDWPHVPDPMGRASLHWLHMQHVPQTSPAHCVVYALDQPQSTCSVFSCSQHVQHMVHRAGASACTTSRAGPGHATPTPDQP